MRQIFEHYSLSVCFFLKLPKYFSLEGVTLFMDIVLEIRQSHTTIAVVEKHSDGTYVLKALKQKLFVDGLCYLLQEIYGIENKNLDTKVNYKL